MQPYECTYQYRRSVTNPDGTLVLNPDGSIYYEAITNTLSGCYESMADMEDVCEAKCDQFYGEDCLGLVEAHDYDCGPPPAGDATAGDATAGAAVVDCSDWSPSSSIEIDSTTGVRTISWEFWWRLIAEPALVTCDDIAFSLDSTGPGFLLSNVQPGSFADALGLSGGDMLLEINGHPLSSNDDARDALIDLIDELSFEIVVQHGRTTEVLEYQIQ